MIQFRFQVNISDQDYFEFNKYWSLKSRHGRAQIVKIRLLLATITLLFVFLSLFTGSFTLDSFLSTIPMLVVLLILELMIPFIIASSLKMHIKSLQKSGKALYSPTAIMEFYDDKFIENTPDKWTEQYYAGIERISIVNGKVIYIHINNILAYILPITAFASPEEYNSFLAFIKTKSNNIDFY